MIYLHDEVCAAEHSDDKESEHQTQQRVFDELLAKSSLAQLMKRVYEDVVETGRTFVRVR